tara:strand:- start:35787 stop:36410 length:624 start_codon:yes stop_codon:yes gene_type:complete
MKLELVSKEILDSIEVKKKINADSDLIKQIIQISTDCISSLNKGGKIIFCGNGGSFADAQHLSAEFTSRFLFDRPALASVALGTNNSGITAMGNDYGYDKVFSRELEAIGSDKDIFIGITTSGNSPNIINAVDVANKLGIKTYILTGKTGGILKSKAECLNVPSNETPRIQESHIMIGHIICGFVEKTLFKELDPSLETTIKKIKDV